VLAGLAVHEGITDITEDHIVRWANEKVASSGKTSAMRSFKDSSLKNSVFLLELVAAIESRAVNFDLVSRGDTYEDQMMNAKYVISNARKVGACVFLTPEDIVEVKSKMILTFVASLWAAAMVRF
jgi:plastin-1